MKTFYAISDTHGNHSFDMLLAATKDAAFYAHLGDYTRDCDALKALTDKKIYGVKGNNDYSSDYPTEELISVEGVKILLLHGHTLNVKYTLDRIYYRALELDAKCVLYGHTHAADITINNGIFLVCPGAFGGMRQSYARITVKDGQVRPDLFVF